MPGFSSISGDESIMFADNASFDGSERDGKLTANGQLWIGAGSSPHVRKGTLTSTGGTVSIVNGPGTINLEAGASTPLSFPTDSVTATPAAHELTISGQLAGTVPAMFTIGSGSTVDIEDRTWITSYVVDPSSTVGLRGTFTTIQAAITAASSGQTIFIRPGTYTENLTLKSGVNLVSMANSNSNVAPVVIRGKSTLTSGTVAVDNISFNTNSDYIFDISGGSTTINAYRCYFIVQSTGAFNLNSGRINLRECYSITTGGATPLITAINSSPVQITNSYLASVSTTASSFSGTSSLTISNSTFGDALTFGGTGSLNAKNCTFGRGTLALAALTITGTNNDFKAYNCFFETGAVTCITIGTGSALTMSNCAVQLNGWKRNSHIRGRNIKLQRSRILWNSKRNYHYHTGTKSTIKRCS
jgi:hypothetical protein